MEIKLIISDIDGCLINGGNPKSFPRALKEEINFQRKKNVLFSFVSGRDYKFIENLREKTIERPIKPEEAILYEDVALKLFSGSKYILGGINKNTLNKLKNLDKEYSKKFEGLVPLPNNNFNLRYSWVTKEFAESRKTNIKNLNKKYPLIKKLIEKYSKKIEVKKSADAIDAVGKNCDKIISMKKYLEILKEKNIFPENVLVIGDSESDEKILEYALKKGGAAGFVGENSSLENRLKKINGNLFVSKRKGPLGTLEIIRTVFNHI